jgi:hypothetical protein
MKSRIFVTTAANRRDPIVLLNFQINYFLPPQMRAIFPRFYAQTHVCNQIRRIEKSRGQGKGGAIDVRDGGGGLKIATLDWASRNGMSVG